MEWLGVIDCLEGEEWVGSEESGWENEENKYDCRKLREKVYGKCNPRFSIYPINKLPNIWTVFNIFSFPYCIPLYDGHKCSVVHSVEVHHRAELKLHNCVGSWNWVQRDIDEVWRAHRIFRAEAGIGKWDFWWRVNNSWSHLLHNGRVAT